jgi:hypothetical protein
VKKYGLYLSFLWMFSACGDIALRAPSIATSGPSEENSRSSLSQDHQLRLTQMLPQHWLKLASFLQPQEASAILNSTFLGAVVRVRFDARKTGENIDLENPFLDLEISTSYRDFKFTESNFAALEITGGRASSLDPYSFFLLAKKQNQQGGAENVFFTINGFTISGTNLMIHNASAQVNATFFDDPDGDGIHQRSRLAFFENHNFCDFVNPRANEIVECPGAP